MHDSFEQRGVVKVPRRILPIPPAPAVFDEFVGEVCAVEQEHVSQRPPVLVLAVSLERDFFAEGAARGGVLGVGLLHDPLEFVVTPGFEQCPQGIRGHYLGGWQL